jgi:hypothetical protein
MWLRRILKNRLTISFKGDHVLVQAEGDKDMEFAESLWAQATSLCEAENCFNVLAISRSAKTLEAMDAYEYARLYRKLGIDHRYRIAWVELEPHATDIASFIDTVLADRGYNDRSFPNEMKAKEWLLGTANK